MLRTPEFTDIFISFDQKWFVWYIENVRHVHPETVAILWSVVRSPSSSVGNALVYWASGSIPIGGGDILKGISGATADSDTSSPIFFTWLKYCWKGYKSRHDAIQPVCWSQSSVCVCVCVCVCVYHSVLTKTMFPPVHLRDLIRLSPFFFSSQYMNPWNFKNENANG